MFIFPGFRGEHINFFVWLTGRLSQGQPDPDQSEKSMFMCLFSLSLPRTERDRTKHIRLSNIDLLAQRKDASIEFSDILFPCRTPSPRPQPDPTQHSKTDPKRTRNRPESLWTRNGPETDQDQALRWEVNTPHRR